jgi:anaerobic magnesium-protoporphyrin IX monomethyl ester cyclase
MRVLLTTLNAKYIHTNLAIRLLYALNRERHAGLEYHEFTIKEDRDKVAQACAAYDIVAFSCYIWNITQTLDAARRIKKHNPAVKILLGGPEVSYDWQDILQRPEVDYIITGEGEIPFQQFLDQYPEVSDVPNLASKADAGVQYHQESTQFDVAQYHDLMPYAWDDPEVLATKVLYIETSRGCPYKCEFCLASLDNKVRYLPDPHIKSTLLYLMQHGKVIKFLDRTFNIKRDFTLDIFQFILDHHRPGNVFQFEITADILHPEIIRFIQEKAPKNLFRFEIGIQTVNREANLAVSRKQSFDKTTSIIRSLEAYVEMHLDLIVGLPLDRWEDIKFSIESVFALHPPELQLGFLKFLKGTPVRYKYAEHDYVFDPEPPYQIIESKYLSRDELHRLEVLEHALEIYWNKKRALHTLKYAAAQYGIFDFLLGLGLYFGQYRAYHQYTQQDVYDLLEGFIREKYPADENLLPLMTLDYYVSFKTRPKTAYFPEIDAYEKSALLAQRGHGSRAVVLELPFQYHPMVARGVVETGKETVVIAYDGRNFPTVLTQNS